ncbi:ParA family protein [Deltaproteobacteria bacterium TL4]
MKIIAIYNIKGGVGKTSTTVNLGYMSSREGAQTLVWDLDPQGATSYYFRIKPKVKGGGKKLIRSINAINSHIKGTDYESLDLLPADFSYRYMDLSLNQVKNPLDRFRRMLKPLSEEYECLFLDCPPSLSLVIENVFQVSDLVLFPMLPAPLSMRAFEQVYDYCKKSKKRNLKKIEIYPFYSMVDKRKSIHKEMVEHRNKEIPNLLESYIPYNADVERMSVERASVIDFAPTSIAAQAYLKLWDEIKVLM